MDGVMVPMEGEDAAPRGRKTTEPEPARYEQRYGSKVQGLQGSRSVTGSLDSSA
jgi:hypothetical protein